ncbi:hypothetical protein FOCC_FOCC008537 [Frankliniella occidentalis]|nr:hypothetical protein FOCC_FOCC008537 [Frankliniella occidentalis]
MDLPIVGSAFHNYEFTSKEEATVQSVRQFELTPMSDEETVISVAPVLTESSELLQAVDVEKRQLAKHHRVCENRDCYLQVMKVDNYVTEKDFFISMWLCLNRGNISRIAVKMKGSTFTVIGRTESYSQPEFLADCGGLLGLFSGFSLITLVEAFFHLVVRWWCHTFSKKKKISRRNSVKKTPHE